MESYVSEISEHADTGIHTSEKVSNTSIHYQLDESKPVTQHDKSLLTKVSKEVGESYPEEAGIIFLI